MPYGFFDHLALLIEIKATVSIISRAYKHRFFQFKALWTRIPECEGVIRSSWESGILLSGTLLCIALHKELKLFRLLYFNGEKGMLEDFLSLLLPKRNFFQVLRWIAILTLLIPLDSNLEMLQGLSWMNWSIKKRLIGISRLKYLGYNMVIIIPYFFILWPLKEDIAMRFQSLKILMGIGFLSNLIWKLMRLNIFRIFSL